MNRKGPTPIPVAVLGPQQSPVVVQSQSEEGEDFQEENHDREACPDIEATTTMGRVRESRDSREDFKKRIEEINRDFKNFDKDEFLKPDTDMDRILGEDISSEHANILASDREVVKEFLYGDYLGSLSSKELSGQPRVNAADLIGAYSVKSGYQMLCEAEVNGVPSGSTNEGVKLF
nr:hypothetical protein CFP56_17897 [Quercus suber]